MKPFKCWVGGFSLLLIACTIALATQSAIGQAAGGDQTPSGQTPSTVLGVDCSRIAELGIDRQANLRAAAIRVGCGLEPPGKPDTVPPAPGAAPPAAAPANSNTITGTETYPKVTQSESTVWSSNGAIVVVNYNDSATSPGNYSGVSRSIDGGATFTRLLPAPFASGHGTNYGDPILVFNARLQRWFAGDLATGCGGFGIGLWTSADGLAWSVGACAHNGTNDDRQSMWVDNNPASLFDGRMYISWNDFGAGQNIYVTHSDDGANWSAPVRLSATFVRNVQITGGPDGTVFVAGMNEGGGGLSNRTNLIYRSTDGGNSWTGITMGASFAPPGDSVCASNSYFAKISPIWRHMGWGQPGVGPGGVVHYAYAGKGVNAGDTGDIYYTRSTNNGSTWSAPILLNTDQAGGRTGAQWMPSLSVTADGHVHVYWYDRRNTTDGQNYEVWGRQSADNGATWSPDEAVSSVLIAQPEQPDGNVQACYAGDYNYATAFGSTHFATWTDGRVAVSGHPQQDVFFAAVTASQPTPDFSVSLNPASLTIPPGGSDTSTATVTSTGGFSSAVDLACSSQPAGVTCSFATNPVTPPPDGTASSGLTINVDAAVPAGNYTFAVTGTSGATTRTATINLQVATTGGGDFTLTCSPSNFNVVTSFSKTSKCTVHSLNGFNSSVSFSCSGQPSGAACSFDPVSVTPPPGGTAATTLTLTGNAVTPDQYSFQAVGTSGALVRTESISLRVRP
jgi:hypothetical protein